MTKYIPVITRGYSRKVPVDDIMYLEQRQRKLAIVTGEETYLSYQRIENIEQLLDERFYHTLKKLVVITGHYMCLNRLAKILIVRFLMNP